MGTRSLTFVYDDKNQPIMNMYRQFDGYPSGHGLELAEFLLPITLVNGLSGDDQKVANGMGCLAAQMVAHFKNGPGGFYIYPVSSVDCGQDYEYHVYRDRVRVLSYGGEQVFEGGWHEFADFCAEDE